MKDTRILFLTRKGEGYVGAPQTRHEFEQEVAKQTKCKFAGEGWPDHIPGESMEQTVRRVMPDCDWVIDRDDNLHVKKPSHRRYKVGLFLTDLHGKHSYGFNSPMPHIELINNADYDAVFMRYPLLLGTGYNQKVYLENLYCAVHWIPWSVSTERFKPRDKTYDVSLIGATYDCYPLRREMWDSIYYAARGYRIFREASPQGKTYDRSVDLLKESHHVGGEYSRILGESRILLFTSSIYRYPIQKYFEGSASKCLLISTMPAMGKRLGFIDGKTFIEVDFDNWEERLQYYLGDSKMCLKIANEGYKMTKKHHNHKVRAKQFLGVLNNEQN